MPEEEKLEDFVIYHAVGKEYRIVKAEGIAVNFHNMTATIIGGDYDKEVILACSGAEVAAHSNIKRMTSFTKVDKW